MKCSLIKRGRLYSMRFRFSPGEPIETIPLGLSDKQSAEKRMKDIAAQRQREHMGILPPAPLVAAARKPLLQHVEDYINDLTTAKRSHGYVYLVELHLKHLCKECGWTFSKDVSADAFERWRTAKRDRSAKTLHDYLNDANAFFRWMESHGRMETNPLKVVSRIELRGKEKVQRRAFTEDELKRLRDVSGRRWLVYWMAVTTGLRRGELNALEWGDLQLDGARCLVRVRASISKNKRSVELPVGDDLGAALRQIRPSDGPLDGKVFKGWIPKMKRFSKDLAAAGIPYVNEQGQRADFHAFRTTLATNLLNAGVAFRVVMEFMRHSDPKLTTKTYYCAGQIPLRDVLSKLPIFTSEGSAVGLSPRLSPVLVKSGQNVSRPVKVENQGALLKPLANKGICHGLSLPVTPCQMVGDTGFEPVTPSV